ncbi:MAG TPA: FAD-binding and (Fe-S)-binding domain-containing protein [Kineosporiaceae bacterium]|nr:FAD-binding and (Fe-S)-binding domain-containing protein [Kineosporiaceae bacterium]
MTAVANAPTGAADSDRPGSAELVRKLRAAIGGEVDDSTRRRAEYSTDASNYRVVPTVVAFPRDVDDLLAAADVGRSAGIPVTVRGGGTSVAGNAVGTGIVLDTSRYLDKVLDLDPQARTAVVQPGTVLDTLQAAGRPHGLRFGPDPSTHDRCTMGGMIGNNACGPHAVAYGRTADNVIALDAVDGSGRRFTAGVSAIGSGAVGRGTESVPGLTELVATHLATIRTELGRFGRQVSGYSLEHLLPENGGDLAKALVGTEGTCVLVLGATVRLVEVAPANALVVLGYPDMATAADAVPSLLGHAPLAVEGVDARLVDVVRRHKGDARVPGLPRGGGWLLVEVGGATTQEALTAAQRLVADAATPDVRVVPAGPEATALWRIREDGAGLAGRTATGAQAWPGWEDAAVPPERLGDYLRGFERLMREHGIDGLPYGHFGDGCVHVRLDLPLEEHPQRLRPFLFAAAELVAAHGGSLSGEHGDGRARSELLPLMYSPDAISAFEAFKNVFDPADVLNPGVLVQPRAVDDDLRRPAAHPMPLSRRPGGLALHEDGGDLTRAVHRCVGVGKCRADTSSAGGFMCPSYLATRDEKDSTRGRARVLQEMANGSLVGEGFAAPEVLDALDLCLSCKACGSDCPAGVDMAAYKAEVLHHAYRGRRRPMRHYALGQLPRWARLAGVAPRLINTALRPSAVRRIVLRVGGMDPRRGVPPFARTPLRRTTADHRTSDPSSGAADPRPKVVLWADSFTDAFSPAVGHAAIRVLEASGHRVLMPSGPACCGLTWISTGQLDGARARLRQTVETLSPFVAAGIPVVGLEPSCTAVLRQDLPELLPDDARAATLAGAVATLAEFLEAAGERGTPAEGWRPPRLDGVTVIAQPHCHHHAVMGYDADQRLLRAAGATVRTLAGCCGLAGNFGMERGHYEVSVAVAERALLPALRAAEPGTVLLADGFSCRTQADQLAGYRGVHLAELLAGRLSRE